MHPKISLEQWRALVSVVETGSYAGASEALHKTQSSVTYAVQKIERLLDVKIFEIRGRKAVLTAAGQVLFRRAKLLLEEAAALERGASNMAAGWEPEVRIAAEIVFPTWLLLRCFAAFAEERPETRIQLFETVLGGTDEALLERRVDFAISTLVPPGFAGESLMRLRGVAVASPDHPLHRLGREVELRDLRQHRQILIRDTAIQKTRETGGWQLAEQRWTVSNKATSIAALRLGLGFAWLPDEIIREELQSGQLKPLPLRAGGERFVELYLVFPDRDYPGKAAWRLAEIIRERVATMCRAAETAGGEQGPERGSEA